MPWNEPRNIKRLTDYREYQDIYNNDWSTKLKELMDVDANVYIAVNLARTIALVTPDLLIGGEAPVITSPANQQRINEIKRESSYATNFYKAVLTSTVKGDCALKVILKNGQIKLQVIQPENFFPVFDAYGNMTEAQIVTNFTETNIDYVLVEHHTLESIKRSTYTLTEDKNMNNKVALSSLSSTKHLIENETNSIGRLTVIHLPNFLGMQGNFGESDFKGELGLFKALNQRLSEIHYIISKHADPKIQVPRGILNGPSETIIKGGSVDFVHGEVDSKEFKIIETDGDGGELKYVHVDLSQLTQAFSELDRLVQLILMDTETSSSLLAGNIDGSQAESGKALRFKLKNTQRKMDRKKIHVEKAIREFFEIAQLLDPQTSKPEEIDIEFIDDITYDRDEQIDTAIKLYEKGMISLKDALKMVYPNSDENTIAQMVVNLIDDNIKRNKDQ